MARVLRQVVALVLLVLGAVLVQPQQAQAAVQATLYVSPSGAGTSCTLSNPCSLTTARDQVRAVNQDMTGDIVVYFLDGTYTLSSTFQLSENGTVHDSGTNGYNVLYRAYPGAKPVISGGKTLTGGWTLHDASKKIYRSYVGQSDGVLQMYVNGVRAEVARGADNPAGFSEAAGKHLVFDAFKIYNGATTTTVNDNDPDIVYDGNNWSPFTYDTNRAAVNATDINNDAHYSAISGAALSYTFTGTGVDVIAEKNSNYSAAVQVFIDGDLNQTVSTYNGALQSQQTIYSISGLSAGTHTIKLVNHTPTHALSASTYSTLASWGNLDQVRINSKHNYAVAKCKIDGLSAGSTLTLAAPCFAGVVPGYFHINWLENAYELLNTPGQFYYNVTDGYMYYIPRTYENLSTADVVIPQLEKLVSGVGGVDTPLHNVQFIGLTFAYGTWEAPQTGVGFAGDQGNGYMDKGHVQKTIQGNVVFSHAKDVAIQANTFTHLGGTALQFNSGSQNNTIIGNAISDVSGGGIEVGDLDGWSDAPSSQQNRNNTVSNNYISSVALQYLPAVGIFAGYNANLTLSHNEIDNMPYSGISFGWGWGLEPNPYGGNNNVVFNKVSNVMQNLHDGGAVYALGKQPGSVIANNYVSGIFGPYGALYLDNGSISTNVNNNVVDRTTANWAYVQNYSPAAYNNVVTNNFATNNSVGGAPNSNGNYTGGNTLLSGTWPAAATTIADNAGLSDGYRYLKNGVGVLVDDAASGITYSGSWTADTNRQDDGAFSYANSAHTTTTSGDYAEYGFTGTGIDVLGETRTNQSTDVSVYIDGALNKTIDVTTPITQSQQTIFSVRGLTAGSHTIKLVTNTAQPFVVDGFRVFDSVTPVAATGVSLSPNQVAMHTYDTQDLTSSVTVAPSNATNKQLVWTSSNPAVASVAAGVVQAKSAGTAVITATTLDGSFTATATVTVTNVAVTGVTTSTPAEIVSTGTVLDLAPSVTVAPANATNKQLSWTTSDATVATVSNGVVTGVAAGNVVITATTTDGGFVAKITVSVAQDVAPSATATASSYYQNLAAFSPSKATDGDRTTDWASNTQTSPWLQLDWSGAKTLNAISFYDRRNMGDWTNGGTLTFSDGSTVAVSGIPNDGSRYTVTFPSRSVTWVKFQIAGGSGTTNVGLSEIKAYNLNAAVSGVAINQAQVATEPGATYDLNANVVFTPDFATNKAITWSSSDTGVATVSNGVITGVASGTAVVTATTVDGGYVATTLVTVTPNLATSATATASTYYQNNASFAPANVRDGNWNTEWASWTETNPWVQLTWSTAQTMNSVTFADRKNLADWTANGTLSFSDGSTVAVSGIPNDGSPYTVNFASRSVTWVKFQIAGGSGTTNVGLSEMKVKNLPTVVPVTGVSLNASPALLDTGATLDLSSAAVVAPSNATNKQLTWSTSDTGVATVSNGVVSGVAAGNALITATTVDGHFAASVNVTVAQNLAPSATPTASSYYQNNASFAPGKATDGNLSTEWASNTQTNPWLQLTWSGATTVNAVTFSDRVNLADWTSGGTLSFSDGSSVTVAGIPNDGSLYTVSFPSRSVTWAKFQIAGGSGTTNVGLREIKVYSLNAPVQAIALNQSAVSTEVGGAYDLKPGVSFTPSFATNKSISWTTSNASVATVSNGVVTGVASGSAVITATTADGGKVATVTVTVAANLSSSATATASTYYQNSATFAPGKATDGNMATEWASWTEVNPWLKTTWSTAQSVNAVTFGDRVNAADWTSGGTLTFSDGSSVAVSGIPNDGSLWTVTFPSRSVTWVKFTIAGGSGTTNVGLSEFKVFAG